VTLEAADKRAKEGFETKDWWLSYKA